MRKLQYMSALLSAVENVADLEGVRALRELQRYAAGMFLLAARPCATCNQKVRDRHMLGLADYLMEEVLILDQVNQTVSA